ncbi:Uncharacterised protein [Citrobacter freundii]|nr:Uncharacterised protein [Citrobacter freundii]
MVVNRVDIEAMIQRYTEAEMAVLGWQNYPFQWAGNDDGEPV